MYACVGYATAVYLRTGCEVAQNFRVFVTAMMNPWISKDQEFLTSCVIVFHGIESLSYR
jgi:hypothetical protein